MILSLFSACGKQPEEDVKNDFRNVSWGMTRAEVERAEGDDFTFASDDMMLYDREEDGDLVILMYEFDDDRLIDAEIAVQMPQGKLWSESVPELIESYKRYRARLAERYGAPLDDDYEVWLDPDPDYINDSQMHNLYFGRLELLSEWETETTEIKLEMYYRDLNFNYILTANPKAE